MEATRANSDVFLIDNCDEKNENDKLSILYFNL